MTETAGQIFAMPVAGLNSEFLTVGKPFGFDVSITGGGDIGELMVRGPAMMLGYLSTTSSLDSPLDSGGWLATGDIVRREPNGLYAIIGRTKEIGIFCGINFSLNAIEGVLEELAQLRE
jgi:fatty-acyl-CoA synthase